MSLPNDFFTIELLLTYAGLLAAVYVIVMFTKPLMKKGSDVWVRPYAAGWAFILQLFVAFVTGKFTGEAKGVAAIIGLAFLNSILIALAAYGAHEVITDPKAASYKVAKTALKDAAPKSFDPYDPGVFKTYSSERKK